MRPIRERGKPELEGGTRIARAAGIIMLGNVVSRLLGLVREQVIGALFGTTVATDVFTVASAAPTMVYDLLVSGAISAALIPVFSDYADSPDQARFSRVVSAIMSLAAVALAVVVAVLVLLAPQLVELLGGRFDGEAKALTTYLARLILPSVLFIGTAGVLTAALYAKQNFALPAFSVAAYNLGIVVGAVLFAGQLGVTALVAGVMLGAVLQLAIQVPGLRDLSLRPSLDFSNPGVRAILKLYAPVALGLVVSNTGVIIDRNLASGTDEGSIAAMRFATTLVQFPLGLVATATSYAVLPTLSRLAGSESSEPGRSVVATSKGAHAVEVAAGSRPSHYAATLRMGMKMVLVLIVPAAVGLAVLREPVVQLLFQRGQFDEPATARTALAFLGYSPSIAFAAIDQLLVVAFYARKDTRTPVLVGVLAIGVYLVVALSLVGTYGMMGLVLANTVQTTSHALVLLWLLNRVVPDVLSWELAGFAGRILAASAVMGAACWLIAVFGGPLATDGPRLAVLVGAAAAAGAVVYAVGLALLRVEEARTVWSVLLSRLRPGG